MTLKYIIISFFFALCNSLWAESSVKDELFPIIINGDQLQSLLGKEISHIRVYAFQNGKARTIPFQIDQKDANNNWVWAVVSNSERHHMNNYDNEDPTGKNIFDHNDQLVFMAFDIGEQNDHALTRINAAEMLELTVSFGNSPVPSGWIYLSYETSASTPLSDVRYMSYQKEARQIQSPVYSLTYSKQNIATIDNMSIDGQAIINHPRIQGTVDVNLLLFNSTIHFNETEINGYSVGYIDGPVRIIKHFVTYIDIAAGIKSRSLNIDHIFYPHHTEVPLPISKDMFVKNMAIKIDAQYPDTISCKKPQQDLRIISNTSEYRPKTLPINKKIPPLVSLNCPTHSMFTMLQVPDELAGQIHSSAYINNNLLADGTVQRSDKIAGFYLATENNFPSGQFQLNIISVFSKKPELCKKQAYIARIINKDLSFTSKHASINPLTAQQKLPLRKLSLLSPP